jgi:hypothetical protein
MSDSEKPKGRTAPANSGSVNIAKIFCQWKSKTKSFVYYNKGKEEDVLLPMPFSFIPLERAINVRGYNHKKTKTFISNEIANLETDVLMVNSYNTTNKERKLEHKGLYKDIKEDFDMNIKYTESIYAAIKNKKGELSIVNLQLNGAGLHHWFDFVKKNNIWAGAVKVSKMTSEKNGDVTYNAPVYEPDKITPEDDAKAAELQEEVRAYLAKYFAENAAKAAGGVSAAPPTNTASKPAETKRSSSPVVEEGNDIIGNNDDDNDPPF